MSITQQIESNYASRAPLAERSAVNRQVLGSIPSGGEIFFPPAFFLMVALTDGIFLKKTLSQKKTPKYYLPENPDHVQVPGLGKKKMQKKAKKLLFSAES